MSSKKPTKSNSEHGTTTAYVVGFILSLAFTLIPYSLVVNQTIKGRTLLAAILGFAFLQMLVQIIFFLHIGRGPKPRWNLFFFVSTVALILVVVGGSIVIINNLHYNMEPPDQVKKLIDDEAIYQLSGIKTGACTGQHSNHQIIIKNGIMSPAHTDTKLCDTLTVINDTAIRELAFGPHDHHIPYAGNLELPLGIKQSTTITLSQTGTYRIHDHDHDATAATFTVTP